MRNALTMFFILYMLIIALMHYTNVAEALSNSAKECMPTCLAVKGSTIASCEKACEQFATQIRSKN